MVFLLIAIGAGLALTAYWTEVIEYGYGAVGATLVGVLLLVTQLWRDRRERRREPATDESAIAVDNDDTVEIDEPQAEQRNATPTDEEPVPVSVPESEPDIVCVIPGRKRFHQPGCTLLTGHESEGLTREEAEEEGFTPCSVCGSNPKEARKAV